MVCGRRREKSPEQSVYNRLADLEWDTPIGEAIACGGDSVMRAEAFEASAASTRPRRPARSPSFASGSARPAGRSGGSTPR